MAMREQARLAAEQTLPRYPADPFGSEQSMRHASGEGPETGTV
jgi:hypothetical protein